MDSPALILIAVTCISTAALLPLVSALCKRFGLVDRPALHKQSVQPIPLSGGITIVLVSSITLMLVGQTPETYWYLCALWSLALIGVMDDRFHLPAFPRLGLQALVVAVFIVHLGEARVESLGPLFAGGGPISFFGFTSYLFTTLCILALINAFNMLDGIDGLAGMLFCVMALGFCYITPINVLALDWALYIVFIGSTAGFLIHNLRSPLTPTARYYLGDSGSLTLSAMLAILAIRSTQLANPADLIYSPMVAVWILALPIMELSSATIRRLLRRQNVMTADRGHIHHRLMGMGLSMTQSVFVITAIALGMMALGIYLDNIGITGLLSFGICMGFFLLYMVVMNWPSKKPASDTESQALYSGK